MAYTPFCFRIPRPSGTYPIGLDTLPLHVIRRLIDAAFALHLFEEAMTGDLPNGLPGGDEGRQRLLRLQALAFVDALAGAGRSLKAWAALLGDAKTIAEAREFDTAFPQLIHLRDSIEHEDERAQHQAWKKPIPLETIEITDLGTGKKYIEPLFASVWVIERQVAATAQDGKMAAVNITQWSLAHARNVCQRSFDASGLPSEMLTY